MTARRISQESCCRMPHPFRGVGSVGLRLAATKRSALDDLIFRLRTNRQRQGTDSLVTKDQYNRVSGLRTCPPGTR